MFVTIGQLTDTVEINTQVRWLVLMGLCLVTIFGVLLRIIYNEYQYIRSVEEYHLESYDNSSGEEKIYLRFIRSLEIDHVVTIYHRRDEIQNVIGFGYVSNIIDEEYIEVTVAKKNEQYESIWTALQRNEKTMLNKTYLLPAVKMKNIKFSVVS